ncbi:MAG: glycosyltransferase family 1 protein [Bacteroidales bacterium]
MKLTSEYGLHIVSFDVPYPPDYGGVIDVFYKIRALHRLGIRIVLHCYEYGRGRPEALKPYCSEVFYYPRRTGWMSQLSLTPYIVKSRSAMQLCRRLAADDLPILFEGLHTTAFIDNPLLRYKLKIYRESNIEHQYYLHLAKAAPSLGEKIFYRVEALRLRLYQPRLKHAQLMLTVSKADTDYLAGKFPQNQVEYLPSFHGHEQVTSLPGRGEYALFHGNLSVAENLVAVTFLIKEVFAGLDYPLVVAGKNPPQQLKKLIAQTPGVKLVANPDADAMNALIKNAHLHVLFTFQPTGLKLKLLNTLYQGRHCLVNSHMLVGTGLDALCHVADTAEALREEILRLASVPFTPDAIEMRDRFLSHHYSDEKNAKRLMDWVFKK